MRILAAMIVAASAVPALAAWTTTSDTVRAAAKDPSVAATLAAMDRIDAAIVAGDRAGFAGAFTADAVVNNPQNKVSPPGNPAQRMNAGLIDYASLDRIVEYAALRPTGEVVTMGEEIVRPRGATSDAGKTVRRRFTDIWRNDGGTWKLALRQATIIEIR